MRITLEENQTKDIIKKYYSEVEGTKVEVGFTDYHDYQYSTIVPYVSKVIEIGGIKLNATEEIYDSKFSDIINYFLTDEYKIAQINLTSYKVYDQREDYDTHIRANIEVAQVNQKVRGRNM